MRHQSMRKLLLGALPLASSLALLAAGCGAAGSSPSPPVTGPRVAFSVQPTTTVTGGLIEPAVRVVVEDAQGNYVMSESPSITVALGTNPGGGLLLGTSTVTAVNGEATFWDLSLDKPGTGYTLTAAAAGLTGNISSRFNVIGEPVATVTVTPGHAEFQPGTGAGLTATTSDAAGNVLTGPTVTWTSSNSTPAVVELSGGFGRSAFVCGLAPGSATITATSGGKSAKALITVSGDSSGGCCGPGC